MIIDLHANAQPVYGSMMKTGLGMKEKRTYKSGSKTTSGESDQTVFDEYKKKTDANASQEN